MYDGLDVQLFSDGSGSLGGPGILDLNDFYQVYKSTEITFVIITACHAINADRDGSVWFLARLDQMGLR